MHAVDDAPAAIRGAAGHDIAARTVVAGHLVAKLNHSAGQLSYHDRLHGGVQVELALPCLGLRQEALDFVVLDGRYAAVNLLDFLGHDVQGAHLVVLRKQDGEGQADVAGTGDGNLHFLLRFESGIKVRH